jgi:hypothetical protein
MEAMISHFSEGTNNAFALRKSWAGHVSDGRATYEPSLSARKCYETIRVWHSDFWQCLGVDRLVIADDTI